MNEHSMQTYTGRVIDLTKITEDDIRLPDISHSLSQLVRFTGHAKQPYTVAQHSVFVSRLLHKRHALWGLMHDATEAYLGDVSRPLKSLLPEYRAIEEGLHRVIARKFGLPWPMPSEVKHADNVALLTEKRDLLTVDHDWGMNGIEPSLESVVNVLGCREAKELFESRFRELTE